MKVLIAAFYLYNENWPEFTRNKTGYGIMMNDIVYSLSEYAEVQFISYVITPGHGNIIAKHKWFDILHNIQIKDLISGFKAFFQYPENLIGRARNVYYNFNRGYVRNIIKTFQPDVVHIHGIEHSALQYIEVCEELHIPYIITLHALMGLDVSVGATQWDMQIEKQFLIRADQDNIPVTVISTGMKRRIEEHYLHHKANNIYVVSNGTRIHYTDEKFCNSNEEKLDLRKRFHIHPDEKIAVVIGSVCERKNQIQIVRAMATGVIQVPCRIFFCGVDTTNGLVQEKIDNSGLGDKINLLGFVSPHLIAGVLEQADLNIVASRDEGFGLSIIESYAHGVPTVTFCDLDAIPDLYNPDTMVKVKSREDVALAFAIEEALEKRWNRRLIKDFAKQFSLEQMAKKYVKMYKDCANS